MIGRSIIFLISELYRSARARARFVVVPYSLNNLDLLQKLYEMGLINFYTVFCAHGKKGIVVGLRYLQGSPCIKSIKLLGSKVKGRPLPFCKIRLNFRSEPGTYLFFSTSRGLLLLEEVYRYRVGGYPILKIQI